MTTPTENPLADLPPSYRPANEEPAILERWLAGDAYQATADDTGDPYSICIPPPNVTAPLHLGHALNNTLQDILTRHARMSGKNAVWLPGTDHAGIATQTVVEKRVLAEEGKRRTDFERDAFVGKIQAWKDEYEATITDQLKQMGCSCDWDRQAFTMDEPRAKAVREAFFQLFKDGLIYRGKRLVNWDPVTQTALADDEVEMKDVDGNFYYLKYPVCDADGNTTGDQVTVATTRPETMLGDTAVAVNPKDEPRAKYIGQFVKLPIADRVIPIIGDDYVVIPDPDSDDSKARMASGFLKVTPAHDPNDYEIGQRHDLDIINVMAPDASISIDHGWPEKENPRAIEGLQPFVGQTREAARKAIVRWFKENDLLAEVKPYRHAVGHSYRSHAAIEPYYSDQWYLKVTDDRLAGAALRALDESQREASSHDAFNAKTPRRQDAKEEPTGPTTGLTFTPPRYAKTFQTWHENIRDWCISRQLWWGHRIPVWHLQPDDSVYTRVFDRRQPKNNQEYADALKEELTVLCNNYMSAWRAESDFIVSVTEDLKCYLCLRSEAAAGAIDLAFRQLSEFELKKLAPGEKPNFADVLPFPDEAKKDAAFDFIEHLIWGKQDPDVLDTWFSSALWPMSTLGWPERTPELDLWNPTSVLCTAREIITLWVSRMVMFNLYFLGQLPFRDVFIHAMIQDGHGQKMSKSLGNGVDPMDIIHSHGADAMRFTLASMTTQTQDVRMPVDMVDPHSGETFTPKFITASGGVKVAAPTQERNGKSMVSSYGLASGEVKPSDNQPLARNTSEKFELGQRFATKLWNATRFALSNLAEAESDAVTSSLSLADKWILSKTVRAIEHADKTLKAYDFHNYAGGLYEFVWNEVCDWYIESVKPDIKSPEAAKSRQALATVLDVSLRLLHPVMPFVTERLWSGLNAVFPQRGVLGLDPVECDELVGAPWPVADRALIDLEAEEVFPKVQHVVGMIREVRAGAKVPPREVVDFSLHMEDAEADRVRPNLHLVETLTNTKMVAVGPDIAKPEGAAVVTGPAGIGYLHVQIDTAEEAERLNKRKAELEKSLKTLDGRLSNEKYTSKAPSHLVQQTRDQRAAAAAELEEVARQLTALE
ncbi:MAG: valine--tRNA ligase [Planctomycetota bacterium]